jgi:hypothetical protein
MQQTDVMAQVGWTCVDFRQDGPKAAAIRAAIEAVPSWEQSPLVERAVRSDVPLTGIALGYIQGRHAWLAGARMPRAYLTRADLRGADLRGANLEGADLNLALLSGADLRGANLAGADLGRALLTGADLRGANLRGAALQWAVIDGADLRGADLRGAIRPVRHGGWRRAKINRTTRLA